MNKNSYSSKFGREIMHTAYSTMFLAPVNTAEHYYLASHLGFNAIKGDVRITKDKKLVMCHDPGITLDENGYITKFDKNNHIKFLDYDLEYFKKFKYSEYKDKLGYCAGLCDFETFVRICKENGKLAYVTLRNNKIDVLVPEVLKILKKYYMEDNCVINSMTFDTLVEVRKYTKDITISQVIPANKVPGKDVVDNLYPLGNTILTLFFYEEPNSKEMWEEARDVASYATDKGIPIHMAQVELYENYSMLVRDGVQGFHLVRPFFPYQRSDIQFTLVLKDGKAEMGNILGSDRLYADVSQKDGVIEIKNIRRSGSGYEFDDGIPALWLNTLPFKMDVYCFNNDKCTIYYKNNSIFVDANNIDGIYYANVNI